MVHCLTRQAIPLLVRPRDRRFPEGNRALVGRPGAPLWLGAYKRGQRAPFSWEKERKEIWFVFVVFLIKPQCWESNMVDNMFIIDQWLAIRWRIDPVRMYVCLHVCAHACVCVCARVCVCVCMCIPSLCGGYPILMWLVSHPYVASFQSLCGWYPIRM